MKNQFFITSQGTIRKLYLLSFVAVAFVFSSAPVKAQLPQQIFAHLGQNDPVVDEGWTPNTFGAGPSSLTPGNDGVDYWDIDCPPSGGIYYHVALPSSDFTDPSGWTATLRVKVNQADANSASLRASMSTADGNGNSWCYTVGGGPNESAPNSGVFYLDTNQNSTRITASVDPTSGYHYYQVIYPGSGGTATADFYIDGALAVTLNRTQVLGAGTGADSGIYWGGFGSGLSGADYSDAQYAQVSLQTGSHPYIPPSMIQSQSPSPNAVNVSPSAAINITLIDGSTPVITNDIQLTLNNVAVSPTISKPTNITTISYQPPVNFVLSSTNTVTLVFNDTASTLVTNTWSFTVASQFLIAEHVGSNNPTTEGFSQYNNGANLAGGNDGVSNFWDISSPSGGSAYYTASLTTSDFSDPSGWTVTASEKVIRANNGNGGNNNNFVAAVDGTNAWLMILEGGSGIATSSYGLYADDQNVNLLQLSSAIDPTSGYRTYQMVYNPTNQTVSYYVDGYFITSVTRSQIFPLSGDGEFLQWGDGTSLTPPEDTQYALVELQAGQHPIAQVFFSNTIQSQSPVPNAINVAPNASVTVDLDSGSGTIHTNQIQLSVNGSSVTPTITTIGTNNSTIPAGVITMVSYAPPTNWVLSSTNTLTVVFNDTASTLVTNTWSFTVASQFIIAEHVGSNNPNTEGFTFTGHSVGVVPGNDGVSNYWELYTVPGGSGYYTEPLTASDFADPSGWTLTASEELIRAYNSNGGNNNNFVAVVDGTNAWIMILQGGSGVPAPGLYTDDPNVNLLELDSAIDPTSGYHTYQMVYNPTNQSVSCYVDGFFISSLTRSQVFPLSGDGEFIQWGDGTSANPTSDTKYALIELQVGQHPIAATTPPSLAFSQTGANLNFSWTAVGFVLQTNGNLSNPSGWANLPGGNSSPISVPVAQGRLFFRLHSQSP